MKNLNHCTLFRSNTPQISFNKKKTRSKDFISVDNSQNLHIVNKNKNKFYVGMFIFLCSYLRPCYQFIDQAKQCLVNSKDCHLVCMSLAELLSNVLSNVHSHCIVGTDIVSTTYTYSFLFKMPVLRSTLNI